MERSLAKLNAAGVRIVLGGDTGIPNAWHGWGEHYELERMVAAGMTPSQVIVAATSAPARVLGLDDLGTVASGKSADFLVLDANPLENISHTSRLSAVYLRGQRVDRAALGARWTAEPKHLLKLLAQPVATAAEIKIWTARAIATVLAEIGSEFERATGHRLIISSDLPPAFLRRVNAGESFDLLISGSTPVDEWLRHSSRPC
jgi:adenine deaminase